MKYVTPRSTPPPGPLTPALSPSGRGRPLVPDATSFPLGQGDHHPLLPAGEKVPEGRMRGPLRLGARASIPPGSVVFSEESLKYPFIIGRKGFLSCDTATSPLSCPAVTPNIALDSRIPLISMPGDAWPIKNPPSPARTCREVRCRESRCRKVQMPRRSGCRDDQTTLDRPIVARVLNNLIVHTMKTSIRYQPDAPARPDHPRCLIVPQPCR